MGKEFWKYDNVGKSFLNLLKVILLFLFFLSSFFKINLFLQSIFHPLPPSTLWLLQIPHILSTQPCFHVDTPILRPTWHLNSLRPPVSWELGASSLNEHRPSSPLQYVSWGPHISWCMLPVWWSSVWEISGVQISWDCWSSYRVTLLLSFSQPSLIQQQGSAFSVHWLCTNNCIWLFQLLVGSFSGQSW